MIALDGKKELLQSAVWSGHTIISLVLQPPCGRRKHDASVISLHELIGEIQPASTFFLTVLGRRFGQLGMPVSLYAPQLVKVISLLIYLQRRPSSTFHLQCV
jgi:hypothetical protein